mmetsp:Transcript_39021/g.85332  ORF Transcript_39021/g.85332 Transcript_39021/m.85332 type:complete len:201 (-) Transcript_39021:2738-3340(-)
MDCGSNACMFLPVGSTSGFRMGSPPGPGSMYSPLSAFSSPGSSLLQTISFRQLCRYTKRGLRSSSLTLGKPAASMAFFQGEPPYRKDIMSCTTKFGSSTRPCELVLSATSVRTAARQASVISCSRATSSRLPLSALRYTCSAFSPTDAAIMFGRPLTPNSGLSSCAMFTNVATLSSAVGGTPTRCRPIGKARDSISISLR